MSEILEKRRIFFKVKELSHEIRIVKNPLFNTDEARRHALQGYFYPIEEYFEKEVPITLNRQHSHIEYRIKCAFCGGTTGWVRRKDAKYCSAGCRKLAYKSRNESQG